MNDSQKADLEVLKAKAIQDISSEPGLGIRDRRKLIKYLDEVDDEVLYDYFKSNYRPAMEIFNFLKFSRGRMGRLKEHIRAKKEQIDSEEFQNIKNKIGLPQSATNEDVRRELKRLSGKSSATWKALKLSKLKVLKAFGIE